MVSYLRDTRMTAGVTVPMSLVGGDLATVTAIGIDPEPSFADTALHNLPQIGDLGRLLHDSVLPGFYSRVRTCQYIRLTPRERECLRLCAEGLIAKQIARGSTVRCLRSCSISAPRRASWGPATASRPSPALRTTVCSTARSDAGVIPDL